MKYKIILKTITWRTGGTFVTIISSFILTDKVDLSLQIGLLDFVVKTVAYYIHEKFWEKK